MADEYGSMTELYEDPANVEGTDKPYQVTITLRNSGKTFAQKSRSLHDLFYGY